MTPTKHNASKPIEAQAVSSANPGRNASGDIAVSAGFHSCYASSCARM